MDNHPITPPPELVEQWITEGHYQDYCSATAHAIAQAARWGADQELEACCEWLETYVQRWAEWSADFCAARRPWPPSLKKQAIDILKHKRANQVFSGEEQETIRRALESLPD